MARHGAQSGSRIQDWNDPLTKGFWSRWILWNKPTIDESINDIENRFGIKINFS